MKLKRLLASMLVVTMMANYSVFAQEVAASNEVSTEASENTEVEPYSNNTTSYDTTYAVEGGNIYFDSKSGIITGADSKITISEIPEKINGVTVTGIEKRAFYKNANIKEITIPSSITSIGGEAFGYNTALKKVVITGNFTGGKYISSGAFNKCANLSEIVFGDGVTAVPEYAFTNCTGLTSITLPEGIAEVGEYAFSGCTALSEINWSNALTSIDKYAFSGCKALSEINLPNSLKSIADYAFNKISAVKIDIPENVTSVGTEAFGNNDSLKKVTVNSNFEGGSYASKGAFNKCTNLSEVIFGDGVTIVPEYTFTNCTGLKSLTLPEGITEVGKYAFNGCTALSEINLPNSLTSIADYAFNQTSAEEINLPKNITSVGGEVFGNNGSLKKVTINSNYSGGNYASRGAFNNCANLNEIVFGEGVTAIADYTFTNCTGLASITLPEVMTEVGKSAFSGCTALESVVLPASITKVGSDAFSGCSALNEISFYGFDTVIWDHAIPLTATIKCYQGSRAETYAQENEINYVNFDVAYSYTLKSGCSVMYKNSSDENVNISTDNIVNYIVYSEDGDISEYHTGEGLSYLLLPNQTLKISSVYDNPQYDTHITALSDKNECTSIPNPFTEIDLEYGSNYMISNPSDYDLGVCVKFIDGEYVEYNRDASVIYAQEYDYYNQKEFIFPSEYCMIINSDMDQKINVPTEYIENLNFNVSKTENPPYTDYKLKVGETIRLNSSLLSDMIIRIDGESCSTAVKSGNRYECQDNAPVFLSLKSKALAYIENDGSDTAYIKIPTASYLNNYISVVGSTKKISELEDNSYRLNVGFNVFYSDDNGKASKGSLKDFNVSIYDNTKKKTIRNNSIYSNTIILSKDVSAGDSLTITLTKENFIKAEQTVTLDESGNGSIAISAYEYGSLDISEKTASSDEAIRVLLFKKDGSLYKTNTSFKSNNNAKLMTGLDEGSYSVVLLRDNGSLWKVSNISEYTELGAEQGVDFIKQDINIGNANKTLIDVNSIPTLDERKISYLDRDEVSFYSTGDESKIGSLITVRLAFKVKDYFYNNVSKESRFSFNIPDELMFVRNSVMLNGKKIGYSDGDDGYVTVNTDVQSGVIVFNVQAIDYTENCEVSASYIFGERVENVGYANVDIPVITIKSENVVNSANVTVSGIGKPDTTADIYADDKFVTKVTVDEYGKYTTNIKLQNTYQGLEHELKAVVGDYEAITSVTYNEKLPEVEAFTMSYSSDSGQTQTVDILDYYNRGITPYVYFNPNKEFEFNIKMSNSDLIDNLSVVGSRNGEELSIAAVKNADGTFVAKGYFGDNNNYIVPSSLSVRYELKEDDIINNDDLLASVISPELAEFEVVNSKDTDKEWAVELVNPNTDEEKTLSIKADEENDDIDDLDGEIYTELPSKDGKTSCKLILKEYSADVTFDDGSTYNIPLYVSDKFSDSELELFSLNFTDDAYEKLIDRAETLRGKEFTKQEREKLKKDLKKLNSKGGDILEFIDQYDENKKKPVSTTYNYSYEAEFNNTLNGVKESLATVKYTEKSNDSNIDSLKNHANKVVDATVQDIANNDYNFSGTKRVKDEQMEDFEEETVIDSMTGVVMTFVNGIINGNVSDVNQLIKQLSESLKDYMENLDPEKLKEYIENLSDGFEVNVKWLIDPSGYVYEVDSDNRIEGVTTTVYYKDENGNVTLWEADEYGQKNPLITDEEGKYAWDVPEGEWQVKYEKDGYETTYSDWLPVPPPQLEVNIPMVSSLPAKAEKAEIADSAIEITFDRHVDASTMTDDNVVLKDKNGNVIEKTIESDSLTEYDGKSVALSYRIVPKNGVTDSEYTVTVKSAVKAYNDMAMEQDQSLTVKSTDYVEEDLVYGDVDGSGRVDANDASCALNKSLNSDYILPIEGKTNDFMKYADVDRDGVLTASDAACILEKALNVDFKFKCES